MDAKCCAFLFTAHQQELLHAQRLSNCLIKCVSREIKWDSFSVHVAHSSNRAAVARMICKKVTHHFTSDVLA